MKPILHIISFLLIFTMASAQNIGINIANPAYRLTVGADAANKGIAQKTGTVEVGFFTSTGAAYLQTWSNHPLHFTTNNSAAQITLTTAGNVGIGISTPAAKLDVAGSLRIRGGNPQPGYVLMATDAIGNAEWKPAPAKQSIVQYISHPAFLPYSSSTDYLTLYPGVSRRTDVNSAVLSSFLAPLQIPVGALIKEIMWVFEDRSELRNITFQLVRDDGGPEPTVISTITSNGSISGIKTLTVPLNFEITEKFHWLRPMVFDWPNDFTILVHGAKITYEL